MVDKVFRIIIILFMAKPVTNAKLDSIRKKQTTSPQ